MSQVRDIRDRDVRPSLNPFRRNQEVKMALALLTLDHHPLIISVNPSEDEKLSLSEDTPRIGVNTTMGLLGKRALNEAQLQIETLIAIRQQTQEREPYSGVWTEAEVEE